MGNADVSSFPPLNTRPTKGCAPWPPFHQSYQQYTGFPYDGVEAATGLAGRERRPSSRSDGSNAPKEEVSNYRNIIALTDEVKVEEAQRFSKKRNSGWNERDQEAPEEFEPNLEFEPVFPLPALVDVFTGEEDEIILFTDRAFLYRYDPATKEWKERGRGNVKILEHKVTCKTRMLMRREQVHKICCNHVITPQMSLKPLRTSYLTWIWSAQDFSEGYLRQETFALKLKTMDQAQEFKAVFEEAQKKIGLQPATSGAPATGFKTTTPSTSTTPLNCNPTTLDLKSGSEERLKFGTPTPSLSSSISSLGTAFNLFLPTPTVATPTRSLNMTSCSHSVSASSDNEFYGRETDRELEPIIPLLEKIQVRNEEEKEELVFCQSATLLPLVDEKWEEMLGDVKILRNTSTGKTR